MTDADGLNAFQHEQPSRSDMLLWLAARAAEDREPRTVVSGRPLDEQERALFPPRTSFVVTDVTPPHVIYSLRTDTRWLENLRVEATVEFSPMPLVLDEPDRGCDESSDGCC